MADDQRHQLMASQASSLELVSCTVVRTLGSEAEARESGVAGSVSHSRYVDVPAPISRESQFNRHCSFTPGILPRAVWADPSRSRTTTPRLRSIPKPRDRGSTEQEIADVKASIEKYRTEGAQITSEVTADLTKAIQDLGDHLVNVHRRVEKIEDTHDEWTTGGWVPPPGSDRPS